MEFNVLVIDDCEDTCLFVDRVLRRLPVSVALAHCAEDGLKKAIACKPSLILLDYFLPDWNGMEVLGALKSEYWLRDIPVIMMTANTDRGLIERAFAFGASDYIAKPLYAEEVIARVRNLLCNQEKLQAAMRASKVDPITCLPNRETLIEQLKTAYGDSQSGAIAGFSLLLFGMRGFSRVVEYYGQQIMDLALREIGASMEKELHLLRIPNAGRCRPLVSRIQGAEFAMILPGDFTEERLQQICNRILTAIERPLAIAGHTIRMNARVSVVLSDAHENVESLMSAAFSGLTKNHASRALAVGHRVDEQISCMDRIQAKLQSIRDLANGAFELRYDLIQEVHGGRYVGLRLYPVEKLCGEGGERIDWCALENPRQMVMWMINELLNGAFTPPEIPTGHDTSMIHLPLGLETEVDDVLCEPIKKLACLMDGRGYKLCLEFSAENYHAILESHPLALDDLCRSGIQLGFMGVGTSIRSLEPIFDDRVHFLVMHPSTLQELERGFLSKDLVDMIRESTRVRNQRLMVSDIDRIATANLVRDLKVDAWSGNLVENEVRSMGRDNRSISISIRS